MTNKIYKGIGVFRLMDGRDIVFFILE